MKLLFFLSLKNDVNKNILFPTLTFEFDYFLKHKCLVWCVWYGFNFLIYCIFRLCIEIWLLRKKLYFWEKQWNYITYDLSTKGELGVEEIEKLKQKTAEDTYKQRRKLPLGIARNAINSLKNTIVCYGFLLSHSATLHRKGHSGEKIEKWVSYRVHHNVIALTRTSHDNKICTRMINPIFYFWKIIIMSR